MDMKRSIVCAAWIGMALAGDALAEESGPYVSASLGQAQVRNPALGQSGFYEDDKDSSWTVGVGYRFNRYIALDFGYVDLGEVKADQGVPGFDYSARFRYAAEGTTMALVGIVPIGRWEPYVKAGMLFSKTVARLDGQILGDSFSFRSSHDSDDPFFGAGLRYRITQPLGIHLDVTYFDKVGPDSRLPYSYLNTSLGVLWQF